MKFGQKKARWPLRYRLAHRLHCYVNRLDRAANHHPITSWLNKKAGSLWITWWIGGRTRYDHRGMS